MEEICHTRGNFQLLYMQVESKAIFHRMIPSFGWSALGAEQNDPDTVNNLLFGHMEEPTLFQDLLPDAMDDSSSMGLLTHSKSDDTSIQPSELPLIMGESLYIPGVDSINSIANSLFCRYGKPDRDFWKYSIRHSHGR